MPRKQEVEAAEEAGSKSARTRERILDAAAHVLSRKGYAGTRLSDVADQAEIQAPAIYYYFPSRDDLIEEVMWSGIAHMREHMTRILAALPPDADPLDRIDAAVEAHLRYCLEISDYTTASIRNAGQVPEGIAVRYAAEASQYGDMWRKLLQDAGQRRPAPVGPGPHGGPDDGPGRAQLGRRVVESAARVNRHRGADRAVAGQARARHPGRGQRRGGGRRPGNGRPQAPGPQATCGRLTGRAGSAGSRRRARRTGPGRPRSAGFDEDDGGGQGPAGRDRQADLAQRGARDLDDGNAGLVQAAAAGTDPPGVTSLTW